ncbi:MAG: MBL fold metallo-hydrolase [Acidobacteria bacterium]|jgi:glyoxylase-like metal-dependent hydrolase (beta-lactamase superfamily II)|nr:MBL fold metallo-hydrolase [Acidobacteriota bacterium]
MRSPRGLLLALLLAAATLSYAADDLVVKRFVVNAGTAAEPFPVNSYLVCHRPSRSAVLIDPGADDERFAAVAGELGVQVRLVLNTHGHFDHVGGNRALRERFAARLAAPAGDRPLYEKSGNAAAVDTWFQDGQALDAGGFPVQVLATPGHTPGSSCFLIGGQLFSGDTLMAGGVGRVPEGKNEEKALKALARVIRRKLLALPAATVVWPGHGRPTTIGEEGLLNPFLN